MSAIQRKHAFVKLDWDNPAATEQELNELHADGYRLTATEIQPETHVTVYRLEFIGRGNETLPNRTYKEYAAA